jgi:hypothetical protein
MLRSPTKFLRGEKCIKKDGRAREMLRERHGCRFAGADAATEAARSRDAQAHRIPSEPATSG